MLPRTYVSAFWRATMKSGLPSLKTSLALAWTQTHEPLLVSSLKTVKPLSPVLITELSRQEASCIICYHAGVWTFCGKDSDSLLMWLSAQYIMSAAWMKL